ncbi:hypothetical protein F4827_005756 [Paraburkholderia bannensis]|uniref:DUF4148 domain-containing protein n=1 Tax=Paraburkholderia bannensis TaxID=765414 RepID=A0A7W9U2K9_9BURK|nr:MULTISPECIES: DUF4148 domain-containing protein [Paraburkholderia]MBB3260716.1 hypothetical protein [Paraburkholderia sp. WP4_3_2]MBB6105886.1 hypothetical protein [Paraburkholderia bannensis]
MKKSWNGALVVLLVSMSTLAHASGTPGDPHAVETPATSAVTAPASAPAPAWNNDGNAHITRAEVYHEMVQAQNDGEFKTLNSTLYAHH